MQANARNAPISAGKTFSIIINPHLKLYSTHCHVATWQQWVDTGGGHGRKQKRYRRRLVNGRAATQNKFSPDGGGDSSERVTAPQGGIQRGKPKWEPPRHEVVDLDNSSAPETFQPGRLPIAAVGRLQPNTTPHNTRPSRHSEHRRHGGGGTDSRPTCRYSSLGTALCEIAGTRRRLQTARMQACATVCARGTTAGDLAAHLQHLPLVPEDQ